MRYVNTTILACTIIIMTAATAKASVSIRVNLSSQSMQVTSGFGESYTWPISSGRAGYSTPTGHYYSRRLERMHYSSKYENAPMPHSIFFRGGYAIHATYAIGHLGSPASHGCIRLSPQNAAKLFAMVKAEGAQISIVGSAPVGSTRFASSRRTRMINLPSNYTADNALAYAPSRISIPSFNLWMKDPTGGSR